jgi:hypothetical protein
MIDETITEIAADKIFTSWWADNDKAVEYLFQKGDTLYLGMLVCPQ